MHAELRLGLQIRCGKKRVARLMRLAGIARISHRRKRGKTRPPPAPHEDLVKRKFVADGPDKLWVTDITEHPTTTGKVYCAAVVDAFSRRVVGWAIADHIRAELVVDALDMARWRRKPEPGTVVHSDHGSQYTSWVFGHHSRQELRLEIVTWIERTYHRRRRQGRLGRLTLIEFEPINTQAAHTA